MTNAATQQAAPPAVREKSEFERFHEYITTNEFIGRVAPFFNGSEKMAKQFVGVVLNAVHKTPDLLLADRKSLLLACMQAARERVMPDGKKGLLTVYNTKETVKNGAGNKVERWVQKVEYQIMSAGMIEKLYESGHVSYVDAASVYEKDEFSFERGDTPRLYHKPTGATDPGPIVASYMIAKLKDSGEIKREVMFRRDIDRIHEASKAPNSSSWKSWFDQMAIKAVIKRGYKQLPSTREFDEIVENDNTTMGFADFGEDTTAGGATPTTAVDKINADVDAAKNDAKPALEDKPGEKVPPMTIDGEAQRVAVEANAAEETKDEAKPVMKAPTFADVGALIARATKERKPSLLDDASSLAPGIENDAHRRDAIAQIADARKLLSGDDGK